VTLAVIALAALASACDVTPPAASANGATISTATLNTQLRTLASTPAGMCLNQLENAQRFSGTIAGAGGTGTYSMEFTNAVLNVQVGDLLAEQFAASKDITLTSADLTTATSDLASTLDGEISSADQQAASTGSVPLCEDATGAGISGKALLSALPADVAAAQVRNQAVDEKLLARGADLSEAAVSQYYAANQAQFTSACVSVIATDTQAHANQLVAQLNAGASFAALAKANSLDTQTGPNGGALGCNYTRAAVEQALQVQSVTVGQPITPVQDRTSGQWIIYEVTSQSVEPLSAAASVARQELLQSTANVTRVSREIVAFAARSNVSVDPQYGTWKKLTVVAPVGPPTQYLLASASGLPPVRSTPPLAVGGASTGGTTPSTGSSSTARGSTSH
jgi:PPIC-type PPIASE domain